MLNPAQNASPNGTTEIEGAAWPVAPAEIENQPMMIPAMPPSETRSSAGANPRAGARGSMSVRMTKTEAPSNPYRNGSTHPFSVAMLV